MSLHYVVLLLGSNLGDTKSNLNQAIAKIENCLGKIIKTSEMIETQPVEFESSNVFTNMALVLVTSHSPCELLKKIKIIEKDMGRNYDSMVLGKYEDRIIDIDIVTFNGIIYDSKKLKIPHTKHLLEREFSRKILESLNVEK
jgi:2-amino-4-hydroxy-6-hydroxymethyldihydropteridine diphosphokinase